MFVGHYTRLECPWELGNTCVQPGKGVDADALTEICLKTSNLDGRKLMEGMKGNVFFGFIWNIALSFVQVISFMEHHLMHSIVISFFSKTFFLHSILCNVTIFL